MVKKFQWYPGEDRKVHFKRKSKVIRKQPKLRKNLVCGTVCIILSGRFRGKRVVFLKQLDSGLILVTGPYKANGVPLRRITQTNIIVTSTKLEIKPEALKLNEIDDKFFAKEKAKKAGQEEKFFAQEKVQKKELPEGRKQMQKTIDDQVMKALEDPIIKKYMKARFTLRSGMKPHEMVF